MREKKKTVKGYSPLTYYASVLKGKNMGSTDITTCMLVEEVI